MKQIKSHYSSAHKVKNDCKPKDRQDVQFSAHNLISVTGKNCFALPEVCEGLQKLV